MTITKENLFLGQQPTRSLLAAIENEAFNGIITKVHLILNTAISILRLFIAIGFKSL